MSTIATRLLGAAAEWLTNQLNPHVPVNEGIAAALMLQTVLKGKDVNDPPASPAEGDGYIVGAAPTGAFVDVGAKNIAFYHNGGWRKVTAIDQLRAYVNDGGGNTDVWEFDGTNWVEIISGGTDPNAVLSDTTTELSVGYSHTPHGIGPISSGTVTPDEANGAMQNYTNGGAHTLAPPTNSTSLHLVITNNASAGAITTSGFTVVTGDSFTTVDGDVFLCTITKNGSVSHLHVTAAQ